MEERRSKLELSRLSLTSGSPADLSVTVILNWFEQLKSGPQTAR